MGHSLSAIILKGNYKPQLVKLFDLHSVALSQGMTLFFVDHYYSAIWQAVLGTEGYLETSGTGNLLFPNEKALARIMELISVEPLPLYAIIVTDYFGGIGDQCGNVYRGEELVDEGITTINQALKCLGVFPKRDLDEFDTLGLANYRSNPDEDDDIYDSDLADELGV